MNRRERLMDAEHDHRQEGAAEDEARDGAAISGESSIRVTALEDAELVLVDTAALQ